MINFFESIFLILLVIGLIGLGICLLLFAIAYPLARQAEKKEMEYLAEKYLNNNQEANSNKSKSLTQMTANNKDFYTDEIEINDDFDDSNYDSDYMGDDSAEDHTDNYDRDIDSQLGEPYVCPECGDSYDGILCHNCGHSNNEIGMEEVSEDEKWVEHMTSIAMFDAEDKRRDADRIFDDGFYDDFDEPL